MVGLLNFVNNFISRENKLPGNLYLCDVMDAFILIKVLNKLLTIEGTFTSLARQVTGLEKDMELLSHELTQVSELLSDIVIKTDLNSLKNETQIFF